MFKAGIMDIADLFVINKADLPGKEKLKNILRDLTDSTAFLELADQPYADSYAIGVGLVQKMEAGGDGE